MGISQPRCVGWHMRLMTAAAGLVLAIILFLFGSVMRKGIEVARENGEFV